MQAVNAGSNIIFCRVPRLSSFDGSGETSHLRSSGCGCSAHGVRRLYPCSVGAPFSCRVPDVSLHRMDRLLVWKNTMKRILLLFSLLSLSACVSENGDSRVIGVHSDSYGTFQRFGCLTHEPVEDTIHLHTQVKITRYEDRSRFCLHFDDNSYRCYDASVPFSYNGELFKPYYYSGVMDIYRTVNKEVLVAMSNYLRVTGGTA